MSKDQISPAINTYPLQCCAVRKFDRHSLCYCFRLSVTFLVICIMICVCFYLNEGQQNIWMKIKLGACQELSIFHVLLPLFGLYNRAVGTGLPDSFLHVIYSVSEHLSAERESQFIILLHHLTP